jgi:hypothetical protein
MAYKGQATTGDLTKRYFWRDREKGNGLGHYIYVTPDTPATIDLAGYFPASELGTTLLAGDSIEVIQVAAIDDTTSIRADIKRGFRDVNIIYVMNSDTTTVINTTPSAFAQSLEYSLP